MFSVHCRVFAFALGLRLAAMHRAASASKASVSMQVAVLHVGRAGIYSCEIVSLQYVLLASESFCTAVVIRILTDYLRPFQDEGMLISQIESCKNINLIVKRLN